MQKITKRSLFKAGIGGFIVPCLGRSVCARASQAPSQGHFLADFDRIWETLRDKYCFFSQKQTDWEQVRVLYRPMANEAVSEAAFIDVVRRVLAELYDGHTHVKNPAVGTPRLPLYDLFAKRADNQITVVGVDENSAAAKSGLRVGDKIVGVNGRTIEEALNAHMPRCLTRFDPEAESYAINVAVAGRRGQERLLTVGGEDQLSRELKLALLSNTPLPDVEWRQMSDNIGYIVIRSFDNNKVVRAFDRALLALRTCAGLIIDVRQNGGGDTAVARPIMGRFITERRPYARMRRREAAQLSTPWVEYVNPRGPFTYSGKVVVLTSYWSASMAEGFPMGMKGIGRATIVGTKMMGLGAAVFTMKAETSKVEVQYSAEPVYDIYDRPRWEMLPDQIVADGQDILVAGLSEIMTQV